MINSSPRSGSAWMQYAISYYMGSMFNDQEKYSFENFLSRTHTPEMLLGVFPENTIQTIIIRNPLDIIPSIITKTYGGLGDTVSLGVNMPHEMKHIPEDSHFIDGQIKVAKKYFENTLKNFDNLYAFTFEDVIENFQFVLNTFLTKFNLPDIEVHEKNIIMPLARRSIETFDYGHPGYSNALPVNEKPEVYYRIKEKVRNADGIDDLMEIYQSLINEINFKKQKVDKKWNI